MPDKGHQKVFPNVPIVGFLNGKSLKRPFLVRASLPILNHSLGSAMWEKETARSLQFISVYNIL